jgi:hypothetical protein
MIRLFSGNNVIALVILPFLIAGYVLLNKGFLGFTNDFFELSNTIDLGLWGSVESPLSIWVRIVSGALILLNALGLNFLFNANVFHEKNTYIVSLLYVVLMSFYHSFYQLDGVIIAQSFLILTLFQLFRLENNSDGRATCFNGGFFFGIAASFHPSLIFVFPLLWLMILRIRPFVWREMVLSFIAFSIPLLYGFSYILWKEEQINWNFIETSLNYVQKQLIFLSSMALFVLAALLSLYGLRTRNITSSIRFRKLTSIVLMFLLIGIGLGIIEIIFLKQYEWFSFTTISLALFLPFSFFYKSTQLFARLLFYVIFLFSIFKFFIR